MIETAADSGKTPVLRLIDVCKKYGEIFALRPLSLEIAAGEFLTVLGPNGAGKSTLLKLISQQTKATSGEIFYKDMPVKDLSVGYRGKLGVISHQPFLYEGLSALENLTFYASLYNVPNPSARAKHLLERVEMSRRMHDPVRTYSRGMLQRTSIARALLHEPEIIFLDEPYTGLDRQAAYILTAILKEQIERNTTIILVTHDLALGYELADRTLILSGGKIVFYGKDEISAERFESFYLEKVNHA
ncbi:MAG: ABC transporter ATP-binding protein [Deferribacteraceae bacterium]|jgi:heme exporter protein A|nr:ABC transporter ATP-binding protein [Deferribacteraceae bacterium]